MTSSQRAAELQHMIASGGKSLSLVMQLFTKATDDTVRLSSLSPATVITAIITFEMSQGLLKEAEVSRTERRLYGTPHSSMN